MKPLYVAQSLHASILNGCLDKHRSALDGSACGAGKTLVAAEIAAARRQPTLVICPKAVIPQWKRELAERGWPAIGVINPELLRGGKSPWGTWGQKNFWQWNIPANTLIIFDEVQKCKALASLNARILIAAKPYHALLLSGSAAEHPGEMRASGYILGLHTLGNFWKWARERGCVANRWGGLDFSGDQNQLAILHNEIFPEHGSRLSLEDLAEYFTESRIITEPLDFGDKIVGIYAEMEMELAALAEQASTDSRHPAAEALVKTLRARQAVELCKVPAMIDLTEELLAERRSVVLFLNFDASIEALHKRFPNSEIIRGGQSTKARQQVIDNFQADKTHTLLCNIQAGGVGLSLHDLNGVRPRAAIISPSWSAMDTIQALGRINRAGAKSDTIQYVFFADHTIETRVEKVVRQKIANIGIINDGAPNKKSVDQKSEVWETLTY